MLILWTYFKLCSNYWLWSVKRLLGSYKQNTNNFEDKIRYIMCYVVVFPVWIKFIKKCELIPSRENVEKSVSQKVSEKLLRGVYFRRLFWLQRYISHSKWRAVWTFVFLQILLARELIRELILSCCKLLLSC